MKPYIGILIDSFWEAVSNKVLWAMLIASTLILAALAPFGYINERSFEMASYDINGRAKPQLLEKLVKGADGKGSDAIQAVAAQLAPQFVGKLRGIVENKDDGSRGIRDSELAKELSAVLKSKNLYSKEAFPTADRREELKKLIDKLPSEISDVELQELNRRLLKLAFPLELNQPRGEQLWVGYAGFKIGGALPYSRRAIQQLIEPFVLLGLIRLGLGVIVVFVAILVTSPIIPDTFKTGSLHLLLSKPISRTWLFLAKFFGGCIFVSLNLAYVLVGLYLIAGFRFDVWNEGILWCIPLLFFVFVIFYTVSSLAGLIWGNAIVSVVACMIFWLFCFAVGFMRDAMRDPVEVRQQLTQVREIEGQLFAVNGLKSLNVWNEEFSVWQPATEASAGGGMRTKILGPLYDAERKRVITKIFSGNPFEAMRGTVSRNLTYIYLEPSDASKNELEPIEPSLERREDEGAIQPAIGEEAGRTSDDGSSAVAQLELESMDQPKSRAEARNFPRWAVDSGPDLPQQVFDMLQVGNEFITVSRSGLYKVDFEMSELSKATQGGFFGFNLPFGNASPFQNIAPKDFVPSENTAASVTADGQGLILYSSGELFHMPLKEGRFQMQSIFKLEGEGTEVALVEMSDAFCVVARNELPFAVLNSQLEFLGEVDLPGNQEVKQLAWKPGTSTQLSVLTHNGELFTLDCEKREFVPLRTPFDGKLTCIEWISNREAWLGVQPNAAYRVNIETGQIEQRCVPASATFEKIYNWAINPLYKLNPKPAALDQAMAYALTGSANIDPQLITVDLEAAQVELEVWQPIISNLAFVGVMLVVCCIYVTRKEY